MSFRGGRRPTRNPPRSARFVLRGLENLRPILAYKINGPRYTPFAFGGPAKEGVLAYVSGNNADFLSCTKRGRVLQFSSEERG
ncbi:MAG: hypothetical protein D6679_02875 [Candidatus Hydrogenedentota bacterium]|nr:MAG: hypothetical protein D6679_02875 [Candidatus Hydrogenedentota bacterium]